jgi:hypothetical protein
VPVAPKQLAAGRARPHLGQHVVLFFGQDHRSPPVRPYGRCASGVCSCGKHSGSQGPRDRPHLQALSARARREGALARLPLVVKQ